LVLARPFGGQVGEASDTHTVREPAVDGRVDEIGREERKRDRHVNSLLDRGYGKPVAPAELENAGEFDHLRLHYDLCRSFVRMLLCFPLVLFPN
jgi:hypothetical protein